MKRFLIRGSVTAVIVVLVATLAPAQAAPAAKARTSTSFGMTSSGGEAALGTVSSTHPACVKKRTVKLFMIRPGKKRKLVGVDRRTGQPSGNGDGYWMIPANLKPGRKYVAVVTKRKVGRVTCKAYQTSRLPYYG